MQRELVTVERARGWDDMVRGFLNTRKTTATRTTYKPTLRELAERWPDGPATVSPDDLAAWGREQTERMESGALAPGTIKRKLMAARSFFKYAHLVGQSNMGKDLRAFVLPTPRGDVVKPFQILSETEGGALLAALQGVHKKAVATMLYAGLRVSEVCRLTTRDYYRDDAGRLWLQVRGKGEKVRQVPVSSALADILGEPKANGGGPLFPGRQGHYSRSRLFQVVQDALKRAGVNRAISPHSLRHTCAMRWVRRRNPSIPLVVIQKWLGHASLGETQKYLDHYENGETHQYML